MSIERVRAYLEPLGMADKILEFMAPIHERRVAICNDVGYIAQVLQDGKARATATASQTMIEVREAMKL